jgi:hypothetical protein
MIKINLDKAKTLTHEIRRRARELEFQPLDIQATIPTKWKNAEIERQKIRDNYAAIQRNIDMCKNEEELKTIYKEVEAKL